MGNRRWKMVCAALVLTSLFGCAVVPAEPSPTRDGKCHGPDYNAPTCIYLF